MSLGVVVKGPEGIVLAVDSRVTLNAPVGGGNILPVTYDNATKFLSFGQDHNRVAAVTYGAAVIGLRTAHSFIPEVLSQLGESDKMRVEDYAKTLSDFFLKTWDRYAPPEQKKSGQDMLFIVGGYDPPKLEDKDWPYGRVYLFRIPNRPEPVEQNKNKFGMSWGGQLQIVSRIIHGYDPALWAVLGAELGLDPAKLDSIKAKVSTVAEFRVPYEVLPLQDCVNLAALLVKTTIMAQSFAIDVRAVGGPIDIATITKTDGLQFVQKKQIHSDFLSNY